MSPKEKIKYVKEKIRDAAEISPSGSFRVGIHTLTSEIDGPTIISRADQWSVIKKLEEEGYIKNVRLDEDKLYAWMELGSEQISEKKKARRGTLLSHIKTTDELIQDRALFDKFLHIIGDLANIKSKLKYDCETDERNDDLIQLLIDLKIVEYDWDKLKEQTHRQVGNRIIQFTFEGGKVLALHNRVSGIGGIVRKEALQLVSKEIGDRLTMTRIVEFFTARDVPGSMFVQDTKWRAVFYVLSFYTTSKSHRDHLKFLKLIQEILHPLMFDGDEKKAGAVHDQYRKWLKYDRISIDDDGKAYLGPSPEDEDVGADDWIDAEGNVIEPEAYLVLPQHVAKLYVLWNQIVLLLGAYQYNTSLDREEMEKLYLEVIEKAEEVIYSGKIGSITQSYKRPFSSLATADIEARAKNASTATESVVAFLLEITALDPDPSSVAKEKERNADLVERITRATHAITGEKIDLTKLSYQQALFLLRVIFQHIFYILEAVSTGYLFMADHDLNVKYVQLSDNLNGILARKDFEDLKNALPQDLPAHLLENMGDMDVWWESGQANMTRFSGDIDAKWIRGGQQTFPLPAWLHLHFNEVEKLVGEHKRRKSEKWRRMEQDIDERKARGEFSFAPPDPKLEGDVIEVKVQNGVLTLNRVTGGFSFNEVKGTLNPSSQEFKLLLKLMTSGNSHASYADLLGDKDTKAQRRNLGFVLRNLKEALGILPLKDARNSNIIQNQKRHGYRLLL